MSFTIKNILGNWPDEFHNIAFKNTKVLDFLRLLRMFHSITTEGKNEFLQKIYFVLKRGMFSISIGVRRMP